MAVGDILVSIIEPLSGDHLIDSVSFHTAMSFSGFIMKYWIRFKSTSSVHVYLFEHFLTVKAFLISPLYSTPTRRGMIYSFAYKLHSGEARE